MIKKIVFNETINNIKKISIVIDFTNNNIKYIRNNEINNKQLDIDKKILTDLISKYTIYWDKEYINNKIIGENQAEITIFDENELIEYKFKNKYPYNFNEFRNELNKLL